MEADFWHTRWQSKQIGFHEGKPNALLVKYLHALPLASGGRVFVPLCGKSVDVHWLLEQGYQVVGVELSEIAVDALFGALGLLPTIVHVGQLTHYHAENIDVYVGDIFDLTIAIIGRVDAVYDRAALIALPDKMRQAYTKQLMTLSQRAPQLLICIDYDQSLMSGPPFSIKAAMVRDYYADAYNIKQLASHPIADGLKGKCPADEVLWLLVQSDA